MKASEVDVSKVSPMMRHYLSMKAKYPDCILFYRLGDFYEMFFEDAEAVSKELDLTLTGKSCGLEERAPMCGVPFHAADSYIDRLVKKGYKVAICEQLEDPKTAKGIVKRGVIRIVTPGTNMDTASLDASKNNYLLSAVYESGRFGISASDISTGEFFVTEESSLDSFYNVLNKYRPAEIIANGGFSSSGVDLSDLRDHQKIPVTILPDYYFSEEESHRVLTRHFHVSSLKSLDIDDETLGASAAGGLLQYLKETQKTDLKNLTRLSVFRDSNYMMIDSTSRRNLELLETQRDKEKRGSLLWVLDRTRTAMGARKLRQIIQEPLRDKQKINDRLDSVEELIGRLSDREEMREYLDGVYDLERLLTRISYRTANPRDLIAFRNSIHVIPGIRAVLKGFESPLLKVLYQQMDPLEDLDTLITKAINEDPPVSVHDGGILKDGFRSDVDELRSLKKNGKEWLADLEAKEREETGIKNLRIRYNKVFGYFIEVTNSYKDLVPERYIRKQTLTNAERYYTDELKSMEDKILGSEDRLTSLENEIYFEILDRIAKEIERVQETARALAFLDVLISFAVVSEKNHYCRPSINEEGRLVIKKGRHPVVEQLIPEGTFVDNDTFLDTKDHRVSIITGPNMAGKSTYMRQTALIVLMAQTGCFVPAESCDVGIVDRIFTRVGASDDLTSGQSTFMVEMNEVADILKNATKDSLLILDEIGRGTSTFDGLSIAEAVVEYIADPDNIGAKTLFATHYHELTELEGSLPGVLNYCSAVHEGRDGIIFLRKIMRGGADRSYGIEVAKLAGLPEDVIRRAKDIQETLLSNSGEISLPKEKDPSTADENGRKEEKTKDANQPSMDPESQVSAVHEMEDGGEQMSFFSSESDQEILEEIRTFDLTRMTPIDALNQLYELQNKVKNRW